MTTPRDYVVQTHPCSEVLAKGNLEAKGFQVFLPIVMEDQRYGTFKQRRKTVPAPMLPGYLFVRLDILNDEWRRIVSARGVRCLLGSDPERPTALLPGELDRWKAMYEAGEFSKKPTTYTIHVGNKVKVCFGPFSGDFGICTVSRGQRIEATIEHMGHTKDIKFPADMLMLAAQ